MILDLNANVRDSIDGSLSAAINRLERMPLEDASFQACVERHEVISILREVLEKLPKRPEAKPYAFTAVSA